MILLLSALVETVLFIVPKINIVFVKVVNLLKLFFKQQLNQNSVVEFGFWFVALDSHINEPIVRHRHCAAHRQQPVPEDCVARRGLEWLPRSDRGPDPVSRTSWPDDQYWRIEQNKWRQRIADGWETREHCELLRAQIQFFLQLCFFRRFPFRRRPRHFFRRSFPGQCCW